MVDFIRIEPGGDLSELPDRMWVMHPFSHLSELCERDFTHIRCTCGRLIASADDVKADRKAMLLFHDKPICATCAVEEIHNHPVTPRYMEWLENGDPRWWSPWFCDCDGCDPFSDRHGGASPDKPKPSSTR